MNTAARAIDTEWLEELERQATERAMDNDDRRREHRESRYVPVDPDELLTLIGLARAGLRRAR